MAHVLTSTANVLSALAREQTPGLLQVRIAELLADREHLAALEAEKAAAEAQRQRLMHELDSEARQVRPLHLLQLYSASTLAHVRAEPGSHGALRPLELFPVVAHV